VASLRAGAGRLAGELELGYRFASRDDLPQHRQQDAGEARNQLGDGAAAALGGGAAEHGRERGIHAFHAQRAIEEGDAERGAREERLESREQLRLGAAGGRGARIRIELVRHSSDSPLRLPV
jgi:hypothetical protein